MESQKTVTTSFLNKGVIKTPQIARNRKKTARMTPVKALPHFLEVKQQKALKLSNQIYIIRTKV